MTVVLNIVVPLLAVLAIGATLYFGIRAFRHKASLSRQAYNVGQQNKRREMHVDMLRAGASLVVALIMLGVIGLSPSLTGTEVEGVDVVQTTTPPTATFEIETDVPTAVPEIKTETAVPTQPTISTPQTEPITPTAPAAPSEPTEIPTVTPLPQAQTAVVNSEVGVWLRSTPSTSGEQLEWLLNGAELVVLAGKQTADDLEWQQVRAASGNEGWVASQFITYNE